MKDILKSIFATLLVMGIFAIITTGFIFLILHISGTEIKTEKGETIKTEIIHFSDSTVSVIVDDDTHILYIKHNYGVSPYLGEHGRPCRLDKNNQIEELTAKEVYGTE